MSKLLKRLRAMENQDDYEAASERLYQIRLEKAMHGSLEPEEPGDILEIPCPPDIDVEAFWQAKQNAAALIAALDPSKEILSLDLH